MQNKKKGALISALAVAASLLIAAPAMAAQIAPTLVLSGGSAVFGLDPAIIVATASAPGVVSFAVGTTPTIITGCATVATTTVAPFVAKCSWLPAAAGPATLSATLTPTDSTTYSVVTSAPFGVKVGTPVQGTTPSPVSLYVDTVLASGSTGVLAPRFGVSCAVTSQFIVGQTIVFRVYGNDANRGGAVLDSSNVASAYITVAGVANPIPLSYGNHSGVAFWSGVLKTGTAPGLYNTLGVINFKVTLTTKDQTTIQVLATKLVPRIIKGVRVRDAAGKQVYDRVGYYRTVTRPTPIAGVTAVWQSNFTPTSQLTLYAVPTN